MTELTLAADSRLVQCPNMVVSPMVSALPSWALGAGKTIISNYGYGWVTWELLQVPRTPAELVEALEEKYGIDQNGCAEPTR